MHPPVSHGRVRLKLPKEGLLPGMNKKPLIIALLLSCVVMVVLWKRIQSSPRSTDFPLLPPKLETKPLIVAKKRIPPRTRLERHQLDELFEIKHINASDAVNFQDAITNIASLTNRYTAMTILKGDIITSHRLLGDDAIPDLAHAIPPGKRAVSIAVSKVTGVGGFIQQGNYVDVIATFKPKKAEPFSKIVLQDILVLAVGNMFQFDGAVASSPAAIAAGKVDLVTLAVTPEEAERLMFLDSGVTFRLVLKNPQDKDRKIQTEGENERSLLQGFSKNEPAEALVSNVPQGKAVVSAVTSPGLPTSPDQFTTIVPPTTPPPPPVTDKVEVWYGSPDQKREFIREPGGGFQPIPNPALVPPSSRGGIPAPWSIQPSGE